MDFFNTPFVYVALMIPIAAAAGYAGVVQARARQDRRIRYGSDEAFRRSTDALKIVLPLAFAGIAGIVSLSSVLFSKLPASADLAKAGASQRDVVELERRLAEVNRRSDAIEAALRLVNANTQGEPKAAVDLEAWAALQTEVGGLKAAVSRFEGLLLSDAEKLLTLPLVKRDMDVFRSEIVGMRAQMELQTRVLQEAQTQGRWIIGTLALGMLALVVPAFLALRGGRLIGGDSNKPPKDE